MQDNYERMRKLNCEIEIYSVHDDKFLSFGNVITGYDFSELMEQMEKTAIPEDGNVYVASDELLEKVNVKSALQSSLYGGMDIQIGYCNGKNSTLNGLEYHKCSEVNIAVTDLVLLLGHVTDIQHNVFSVDRVSAFYIPQGTAVELYQTTLHFAPCKVQDTGFKCVVVLLKGTNEPLTEPALIMTDEDQRLFKKNKWLLAHPERKVLIEQGALPGIYGPNICIHSMGV